MTSPTAQDTPAGGAIPAVAGAVSNGAQLGLTWSAADGTLRPVVGVPGSAQFGSSIVVAGNYTTAAYSAQSQVALLIDKSNNLYQLALPSTQPSLVTQSVPANASIAFAPHGGWAAVYVPGGTSATVIRGLAQQPVASVVTAGAGLVAASISDAGTLLLAVAQSGGVSVSTVTAAGTRTTVATLGGYGGASFVAGSEDALLADAAANTLARLHGGTLQTVATSKDGLNQPLAVAASLDSRWAVTANRADGTLVRIDLTAATPSSRSSCSCSPTGLTPLNGNAVFQLTAPGTSASWMIEADAAAPRVLFIPPVRRG